MSDQRDCKHTEIRKLFWMDSKLKKWQKTNKSICIKCKNIISGERVALEEAYY